MSEKIQQPTCLRCARLEKDNQALRLRLQKLEQRLEKLTQGTKALEQRVDTQERKLNTNSSNSSKPPSADTPAQRAKNRNKRKAKRKRKSTGKSPGGQPGHKKHERVLVPVEQVNELHVCKPECCAECGDKLEGEDPEPKRHQIQEIPPVEIHTTEYQLHSLPCQKCEHTTPAKLPQGVSNRAYGPRLIAFVALLCVKYRSSKRLTKEFMKDAFGLHISLGTVVNLSNVCRDALKEPVEAVKHHVAQQPFSFVDETGWKEGMSKHWLWVMVTSSVTLFIIRANRAKKVAVELLGEGYKGIVHSDRYGAYTWLGVERRQICWAHLIRDFTKMSESKDGLASVGQALLAHSKWVFLQWDRVRDGTTTRATLAKELASSREAMKLLLEQGRDLGIGLSGMCQEMLKVYDAFWTFLSVEGVEPTNNTAERALRPSVIWRRLMQGGTQSRGGSLFVERVMTATSTLKQQNRDVLEYLTQAVAGHLSGGQIPSLLPLHVVSTQYAPAAASQACDHAQVA